MRVKAMRGSLLGLAIVFAAAGASFVATEDSGTPEQWTVGEDDKFGGGADDHVLGTLDLPDGEPPADVLDASPVG